MNLTPKQLTTPVYVYVKQAYDYRDLTEVAVGRLTVQHLFNLMNEQDGADEAIQKELNASSKIQYSFSINLEEAIDSLLKGEDWSEMDEVGYIAFSLKSTTAAKKEVARMLLEEEGLGD